MSTQATRTERPRTTGSPAAMPDESAVQRPPYLLALAAALAVFALYAFTLAPTTAFWDTSEYIATSHIMGIPHPPGNPLFVLLARAWDVLLSPTGLPVAVRINLFSAFMSAGTTFFWFLMVHRILGFFDGRETVRRVGAGVAVLVAGTAYTVWNQSNVNEKVYTVSMFTIAALSWLAFLWRDHVEEHRGVRGTSRFHDDNVLVLMVFMLALSVGNHLMAFLAAPALLLFILMVRPRSFTNWRLYAFAVVFGVVGLSVHLLLSTRAGLSPIINEANPSCPSLGSALISILGMGAKLPGYCVNLTASLAREQYGKPSILDRQAPFWAQMGTYFQYFDWQWARSVSGSAGYFGAGRIFVTLLFTALGGYGAWEHWKRDRKSFAYVAVLFLTLSVGLVIYMNFKYGFAQVQSLGMSAELAEVRERDYFFLVSFSLWGLWSGIGLTSLWLELEQALGGEATGRPWWKTRLAMASPVFLLALVPLALNWSYANRRGDYAARDLAYNLLQSVEPYGVLFTNGDNDTFPLWYLQEVEGIRKDVTVIVLSYLNTEWYPKQLRNLTSPCNGRDPDSDPTRIICQRPFDTRTGPRFYDASRKPTKAILGLSDNEIDAIARTQVTQVTEQGTFFSTRGIEVPIPQGKYLYASDQFLLSIIQHAWGDRPIFFASTTNVQYDLGFLPYVARQGMAFKLVTPQEAQMAGMVKMPEGGDYSPVLGAYMDPVRGRQLVDQTFQLHDLATRTHWADDATRNIPIHYFYAYIAQAQAETMAHDQANSQRHQDYAKNFDTLSRN